MADHPAADSASTAVTTTRTYKYTNPEGVRGLQTPNLILICWPKDSDSDEEEDEEVEDNDNDGEGEENESKMEHVEEAQTDDGNDEWEDVNTVPREVTDKGYPITKEGMEIFIHMMKEMDYRNQDNYGMHIFNDWTGYGVTEVLENTLIAFNRVLFKKDVSPVKKWAYVEAIVTYLAIGDLFHLMMNDNSEGIKEVFEIFMTMLITSYEMLKEHDLVKPDSAVPNVGIITLLFLDFIIHTASDFDMSSYHEIVRAADKVGVVLEPRKELKVTAEELEELRELYQEEIEEEEQEAAVPRVFDWEAEFRDFKKNHKGGSQYNIEKMSKRERAEHSYR